MKTHKIGMQLGVPFFLKKTKTMNNIKIRILFLLQKA